MKEAVINSQLIKTWRTLKTRNEITYLPTFNGCVNTFSINHKTLAYKVS